MSDESNSVDMLLWCPECDGADCFVMDYTASYSICATEDGGASLKEAK